MISRIGQYFPIYGRLSRVPVGFFIEFSLFYSLIGLRFDFDHYGLVPRYRTLDQQENRCFTTNHKFDLRRSTHTGNYD
nr:NAD(P)H-quinone oxidoreductase subunit K [Thrixspermum amplexicaule]